MKINKFENYIKEALVRGGSPDERSIDLRGPGGNSYVILGMASNLCNQLKEVDPEKYDWERINKEMTSGDYKNLVNTFEEYFGDYVTIYNADVLDESMVNEEFKNPFKKKVQVEPNFPIEEFTSPKKEKIIPEEGYDLDRFYSAINKLYDKGQNKRKENLSNLFFRKFLGKELLNSTIEKIIVDVNIESDLYGMTIYLEDGTKIHYNFSKKEEKTYDHITIEPFVDSQKINKEINNDNTISYNDRSKVYRETLNKAKEDAKKVSRKDARLIGQITKRFNPDTKYATGTGDLVVKEYESRIQKFNNYLNE